MPLPNTYLLNDNRIRLTAIRDDDLSTLKQWYKDADFARHYDSGPVRPRADWSDWLKEIREDKNSVYFAIRRLDTSEMIGIVDVGGIQWTHRTAFIGLAIGDPANRRQGYGRAAMQLVTRYAFHELNLRRLCLTVFSYNTPAITLYESLGWVHEGTYREHLVRDGQVYDMLLYGLLAREWETTQQ
jgi:RimJ/RimL family protein N-acetyltransferase